jgi:hypothetical protein
LANFPDEHKHAIKIGAKIRLIFEGEGPDILLKEKVSECWCGFTVTHS